MASPLDTEDTLNRKWAVLYIMPFLLLGLADVVLLLGWGLRPFWGLLILPPILFITVIGYIGFRTGQIGPDNEETAVVDSDPE